MVPVNAFYMNGYLWRVKFVEPYSKQLVDRTNILRVATTDPYKRIMYLSLNLRGDFLKRVLIHELGHCAMFSYNLIGDIHRMVYPEYWIEAEEWVCNFIADYGTKIFDTAYSILGENAWISIPYAMDNIFMKK